MRGGILMEVIRTHINANLIAPIIQLPEALLGKDVDITICEHKPSIVDELYGIASNVKNMTLSEIRDERLQKQ